MRKLHLVGFPHTRATADFCGCAYTAKTVKFCKMMAGHSDVVLYATEGSEVEGAELVPLLSDAERQGIFGPDDPNALPAWPSEEQWRLFNARAIVGILERAQPDDLILLAAGRSQKAVKDALGHLIACEPGVGYGGPFTDYCAYESYAWMHFLYAKEFGIDDGRWFDAVIPNYFDEDEFPKLNPGNGDYLLFVGRLIQRKAPHVAAQIATALEMPLLVAGAGAVSWQPGKIVAPEVTIEAPGVEYIGPVGVEERAELMAGARALIAPTIYIEPFGGVAVEAMMCGTPAITTDWGAFTETVQPGVSGYRFRRLQEGIEAAQSAATLDPERIREWARSRYSLDAVRPQFERWFGQLDTLRSSGWSERTPSALLSLAS